MPRGGKRDAPVPAEITDAAVAAVCEVFAVKPQRVLDTRRQSPWIVLSRHLLFYLLNAEIGYGVKTIGRAFGRNHQTIRYSVQLVEDLRDTPAIEIFLKEIIDRLKAKGVMA